MNDNECFDLSDHRYLRLKGVLELIPISRSTWYKWIQCRIAPQSTHISLRVAAWKAQDIKNLLDDMGKPEWSDNIKSKMSSSRKGNFFD